MFAEEQSIPPQATPRRSEKCSRERWGWRAVHGEKPPEKVEPHMDIKHTEEVGVSNGEALKEKLSGGQREAKAAIPEQEET